MCERTKGSFGSFDTPLSAKSRTLLFKTPFIKLPSSPLLRDLGYGTGVEVKLVQRSPRNGRSRSPWAIKYVRKSNISDGNNLNKRIKEEAQVLRKLDHPNVVNYKMYAKEKDTANYFLAMEAMHGSIYDQIEKRIDNFDGPYMANDIIKVCKAMSSALEYLHSAEVCIIHGDVKSANILAEKDLSQVRLCDFGNAAIMDPCTRVRVDGHSCYGTQLWTCKEVIEALEATSDKADVYAFGCVIYEMLTLELPHLSNFPDDSTCSDYEEAEDAAQQLIGTRPYLESEDYGDEYHRVIEAYWVCCDEDPHKRPLAAALKKNFDSVQLLPDNDEKLPQLMKTKLCFDE